jgi:rod shape-determining protein MreC
VVLSRNTVWLSGLAVFAVLLLALSPLRIAGDVEGRIEALVAPAAAAFRGVTQPLTDVLLNAGQVRELASENAELRQTVARLEAEATRLRETGLAAEQVAALEAAAGGNGTHVAASVLLRDPTPSRELMLIDRGAADGIVVGQPVLGPGAVLVGAVSHVDNERAWVRLLSDSGSSVTAVVQSSRTQGALSGGDLPLRLEFVPLDAPVREGDIVLTSALGGLLPGGLSIGRVTNVVAHSQDLFETIEVEPFTDYRRLEHVLVLTDFRAGATAPTGTEGASPEATP